MGLMLEQNERLERANELLEVIASCGRQFFRHEDNVARLEIDERGRVWFIDYYTRKRVYTHHRGHWRGFTGGGTLRSLIERLRDFVKSDRPLPECYLDGDRWGYGDDMDTVFSAAVRLSII